MGIVTTIFVVVVVVIIVVIIVVVAVVVVVIVAVVVVVVVVSTVDSVLLLSNVPYKYISFCQTTHITTLSFVTALAVLVAIGTLTTQLTGL